MRVIANIIYTFLALSLLSCTPKKDVQAMREMAGRLFPAQADNFRFQILSDTTGRTDFFEISSKRNKIIIRGNSANSLATGLNHYLKYYCQTSVSWYLDDPIEMPAELPMIENPIRITARTPNRFFLNYCTFGYTMPWWKWEDWERLIDWMALNGINMPLAITSQEAVWYNVWTKMGLSDEEIRSYFTGPPYLPWHRMSNLDSWQGPLPKAWIDGQAELQKQIVERERELGMKPILPAFAGHVPAALKKIYPNAKISRMSSWGDFDDQYRSHFLSPEDTLFALIQKEFLNEQTRLFGTDHLYGADPFNEVDPPSWQEDSLAMISEKIFHALEAADPEATWVQMTWLFYMDRHKWTDSRIGAFLTAVPKERLLLLDYYGEHTEVWKQTSAYHGQPFIWCYLGNFGGNTMLAGNMQEVGKRIENVYQAGGENFSGIGSTLEALDVNPYMYEYLFEKAWDHGTTDREWIKALAARRVGKSDPLAEEAWQILYDKIYQSPATLGQATLTNARPSLTGHGNWTTNPVYNYDNKALFAAWEKLLSVTSPKRDTYLFDLVNIGRQVLGNHFMVVRDQFTEAYAQRDLTLLQEKGKEMLIILEDMDKMLSCHPTFSLRNWITSAESFGEDPESTRYYAENARNLISTWGDKDRSLNDYANRSLSGFISSYYAKRWEMFIKDVTEAVAEQRSFDEARFHAKVTDFEYAWCKNYDNSAAVEKIDNPVSYMRELMKKYKNAITNN
ncbi:MAG: alpha-N-acetylglucosaminidase [Proteiniphilum sp.]|nr:alpha-N-acetylglucosaminidase [Proteiniphilum sp.]